MKCREVTNALVAYLDGEVMPSERTLIDAHLAGCDSCERELAALGSSRSRVTGSLKNEASQVAPSPRAWSRLQAKIAEEAPAPGAAKLTHFLRKGDRHMKLRWRIALGTAGAVVLAAAVIAAVPTSRAAAGGFFADVFNIQSGPQAKLGYLPEGFKAESITAVGSGSIAANGQDAQSQEQTFYKNGDRFVLVKTSTDKGEPLPKGQATEVNGQAAVLATGLSGTATVTPPELDAAQVAPAPAAGSAAPGSPVTILGSTGVTILGDGSSTATASVIAPASGIATASAAPAGAESGLSVSAGTDGAPVTVVSGDAPDIPAVDYTNGSGLTWVLSGTRVEILTNLPVAELQKIADGLVLSK